LSQPKKENYFLQNGKLSKDAYFNRLLLRKIMLKAGFTSITSEWWHFNSTNKTNAANRYELIN
jgi:D-alanyl-D-alanine dipeptidase